ncbi:AI-2E family transporter [Aromatoleum diolicum]|uniref:AI-2E family transporter n=1 Tax=Aromatoleum diolicum TaxID=75796 RepID=A0ABX1QG03_9RHOO|nr:AI-2E family transporter [Aromatoleum diolicum]NMG75926.1 AI-2E family transporter [Aromatoleum diolicum]
MPNPVFFYASLVVVAGMCWLILAQGLIAPVLFGSLVFLLTRRVAQPIQTRFGHGRAHFMALALVATVIVSLVSIALMGALHFSTGAELQQVVFKLSETLAQLKSHLPDWADQWLPENIGELQASAARQLKEHAASLSTAGLHGVKVVAEMLVCAVVGSMLAITRFDKRGTGQPLANALWARFTLLQTTFSRIVTAQAKISTLNTLFTACYLLGVLPLLGIHLPYAKTLVGVTFLCGLLPVVGNLISNSVIVLVSLSVSFWVSLASLTFLVVIHKVEYFLNARIIGNEVGATAWELLIAMLVGEALFGVPGVVAAPILYGYIKQECKGQGWV